MFLKKLLTTYWFEIIVCSVMWNAAFFLVHKTTSIWILGLAAVSTVIFAHTIAKIVLIHSNCLKHSFYLGLLWGVSCLGAQTTWAVELGIRYFNHYGWTILILFFLAFTLYSSLAAVFGLVCGVVCKLLNHFLQKTLDMHLKAVRYLAMLFAVMLLFPAFFSYISTFSLWPFAHHQGYPFFSPLLPLASSDTFLSWIKRIRGVEQNFRDSSPQVHFVWLEPRAYKRHIKGKNGHLPPNAQTFIQEITHDLHVAVDNFKKSKHHHQKLILLAPESYFPLKITDYPEAVQTWSSMLNHGCYFAFGTYRSNNGKTYRTTCILDHTGIKQFLDKQSLMPFAEKKLAPAENQAPNKAIISSNLTLVPLVCYEFFIDGSTLKKASNAHDLPIIFANDFWFAPYFKVLLRNQARLSAAWYGKNILYLSHYQNLCITTFSDSLCTE